VPKFWKNSPYVFNVNVAHYPIVEIV